MAVKSEFSDQQWRDLLSQYHLGAYQTAQSVPQGQVQSTFFLYTTQGRFVFKYYENRSVGSVLFECHLLHYLKNKHFPCPSPLKNNRGKYIGVANGKPYAIFDYIEGQQVEHPTEAQIKQLIQKVAELQIITKNYRPRYKSERWNYGKELCRELANVAAREIGTAAAREKLVWVEQELAKLQLPQSLPKGICHGDFHVSNVLFQDAVFHALLDFDDANYTFLIFDLAALMNPFLPTFKWNTWSRFQPDENVLDFREAKQIVREYSTYRPLNQNERRHLFDVFKLTILLDCIWYFPRGEGLDFYEKRKIDALNRFGREPFYQELFISMPADRTGM